MKSFLYFIFGIFTITLLSMGQKNLLKTNKTDRLNRIDTLELKEFTQIITYEKGMVSKIRVQRKKVLADGSYLISQDLSFDSRGALDSLYTFHGKKEIPQKGYIALVYQSNHIYFDTIGNVVDFEFMRDFKVKYKSSRKK
jgi:hypothetical protein